MNGLACSFLALGLLGAMPVSGAGVDPGPDSLGVDLGQDNGYRDHDREADRPYGHDEGRSVYRDRMNRQYREDQDQ